MIGQSPAGRVAGDDGAVWKIFRGKATSNGDEDGAGLGLGSGGVAGIDGICLASSIKAVHCS